VRRWESWKRGQCWCCGSWRGSFLVEKCGWAWGRASSIYVKY